MIRTLLYHFDPQSTLIFGIFIIIRLRWHSIIFMNRNLGKASQRCRLSKTIHLRTQRRFIQPRSRTRILPFQLRRATSNGRSSRRTGSGTTRSSSTRLRTWTRRTRRRRISSQCLPTSSAWKHATQCLSGRTTARILSATGIFATLSACRRRSSQPGSTDAESMGS